MMPPLLLLLFLSLASGEQGGESSCVQVVVDYHQCVNKEQSIFNAAVASGPDGRRNWLERKFCNFLIGVSDNCDIKLGQCYSKKESQDWEDMNLEVILDQAESLFIGWDSKRCPVMAAHLQRRELAVIDEGRDPLCTQVRTDFNQCRKQASAAYVNAMRAGPDGRPHWEARKFCNYHTAILLTCPQQLLGPCYSEDQITKMSFWEVIDESSFNDIGSWDTGKCPAVKETILRWKAVAAGNVTTLFPDTAGPTELHLLPILSKIVSVIKKAFAKQPMCVKNLMDHNDCLNTVYKRTDAELAAGQDGRRDWSERKVCNLLTYKKENCDKILSTQCFSSSEQILAEDTALEVYADMMESYAGNWDSKKCPAFSDYLERKEAAAASSSNDDVCAPEKINHITCSKKAMKDFMSALLFSRYDGRPNFKERKLCNFVTDSMSCVKLLQGQCFSEEDIARKGFYYMMDESFARDYSGWDTDKCPAVKEHLARWKKAKKGEYVVFSNKQGVPVIISFMVDALSIYVE